MALVSEFLGQLTLSYGTVSRLRLPQLRPRPGHVTAWSGGQTAPSPTVPVDTNT